MLDGKCPVELMKYPVILLILYIGWKPYIVCQYWEYTCCGDVVHRLWPHYSRESSSHHAGARPRAASGNEQAQRCIDGPKQEA